MMREFLRLISSADFYLAFLRVALMIAAIMAAAGAVSAPMLIERGGHGYRAFLFGSFGLLAVIGIAETGFRSWMERMYRLEVMDRRTDMRRNELGLTDEPLTPVGTVRGSLGDYDLL